MNTDYISGILSESCQIVQGRDHIDVSAFETIANSSEGTISTSTVIGVNVEVYEFEAPTAPLIHTTLLLEALARQLRESLGMESRLVELPDFRWFEMAIGCALAVVSFVAGSLWRF